MNVFDLNHIGIAVHDMEGVLDALVGELGATPLIGERVPGFEFVMLRMGDAQHGMNFEVLRPWRSEEDDFLERFLATHGEGPHHLSFMVPDLPATIRELRGADVELRGTELLWAPWQETFIPPCCGHGTVVQVAASSVPYPPMADLMSAARTGQLLELPRTERATDRLWWAERMPSVPPALLERVDLHTRDPLGAERLFSQVLHGRVAARGDRWVELAWATGSRLRVVEDDCEGIHHVEVAGLERARRLGGTLLMPCEQQEVAGALASATSPTDRGMG